MAITSDFESEHRGSIPRIPAKQIAVSFWEGVGLQNQQAQFDSEHGCHIWKIGRSGTQLVLKTSPSGPLGDGSTPLSSSNCELQFWLNWSVS